MGVISKLESAGAKVKAAVLKAVAEVDGVVLPDAEKLEPFVAALMNAVVPGSGNVAAIAENSLIALAQVLDAGGAAAEASPARSSSSSRRRATSPTATSPTSWR